MPKWLAFLSHNLVLRILICGFAVMLPIGISTAWLGAAYNQAWRGENFWRIFILLLAGGIPAYIIGGLPPVWAIERWLIRERAKNSLRWTLLRIGLYSLVGLIQGLALQIAVRLLIGKYPLSVEGVYYLQAFLKNGLIALLFTILERTADEIEQYQARMQAQIASLTIQINEARRQSQVKEITETDYFSSLQQRAGQFRAARQGEKSS